MAKRARFNWNSTNSQRSILRGSGLLLGLAILAALITCPLLISSSYASDEAGVEIEQVQKPQLEKRWVWKKAPRQFDYMWRVPRH